MRAFKVFGIGLSALVMAAAPLAAQAATIFDFTGGSGSALSVTTTGDGRTVTATAFRVNPPTTNLTTLTNLSALSAWSAGTPAGLLRVTSNATGIGVRGGQNAQLDTNFLSAQETLLLTASQAFKITGLKLGIVDANDTLQIYGVKADGSLVSLGFAGTIASGLGGAAISSGAAPNGITTLTLNNATGKYNRFLFTTAARGNDVVGGGTGQGYMIAQITAAIPEPGTWAMMILGLGMMGFALRRRAAAFA